MACYFCRFDHLALSSLPLCGTFTLRTDESTETSVSEFVSKVPDVLIESLQHSAGLKILFWWLHQRATARTVAVSSLLPSKLWQIKMAPLQFLIYVRNLGKTTRAALAFTSTDESEQPSMREPTIFCCCARRLIPACHICRAP